MQTLIQKLTNMATKVDNFNEITELRIMFYPSSVCKKECLNSTNSISNKAKTHKKYKPTNALRNTLRTNHIQLINNNLQNTYSTLYKSIHIAFQNVWFCPAKPYVSQSKTLPNTCTGFAPCNHTSTIMSQPPPKQPSNVA